MLKSLDRLRRWRRAAWMIESFRDIAIAAFDRKGRCTHLNSAAVELLRRRPENIIGKTVFDIFPAGDASKLSAHLRGALTNSEPLYFEEYLDSVKVWFAFHCYPIRDGLACHFCEITKSATQAEESKKQEWLRPLPLWQQDPEFIQIFSRIEYTLVDHARCYILHQFAKQTAGLPGDLAEVGVYKGGTAKLLALTISPRAKKTLHLFDTFTGMPPTQSGTDYHHAGDLGDTSLEGVQRTLQECGNVRFYKGFFPDTAGPVENSRFCMVHIDADIYQSVKDSCVFFYPRLEKGGVMVFDDYGFMSCPGARKAVDEFFSDKPESPVYLPSGQCIVIKR
jgi:O-methyltransferase